jgi:hypothetical protein
VEPSTTAHRDWDFPLGRGVTLRTRFDRTDSEAFLEVLRTYLDHYGIS